MTNGEKIEEMTGRKPFIDDFGSPYMIFSKAWWDSEYKEKDAEKEVEAIKTEHNCLTCKYGNLYSDSEPCCNCTEDNDMYEPNENEATK